MEEAPTRTIAGRRVSPVLGGAERALEDILGNRADQIPREKVPSVEAVAEIGAGMIVIVGGEPNRPDPGPFASGLGDLVALHFGLL